MAAKQVLDIRVLNCAGMFDTMSEQEAAFLFAGLPLFRNVVDLGRAVPRARVSSLRAYNARDFFAAVSGPADVLHLIAHASDAVLEAGASDRVAAAEVLRRAQRRADPLVVPSVIVSTACRFGSDSWHDALRAAGAEVLVAADGDVTPGNLAAFDMAFYSALLSRVHKNKNTVDRVCEAFDLADKHYRDVHAPGAKYVKFRLTRL